MTSRKIKNIETLANDLLVCFSSFIGNCRVKMKDRSLAKGVEERSCRLLVSSVHIYVIYSGFSSLSYYRTCTLYRTLQDLPCARFHAIFLPVEGVLYDLIFNIKIIGPWTFLECDITYSCTRMSAWLRYELSDLILVRSENIERLRTLQLCRIIQHPVRTFYNFHDDFTDSHFYLRQTFPIIMQH